MTSNSPLSLQPSSISTLSSEYDFIIIGGGTAGLTLASRLSEDPNFNVLVLEAGADLSTDPKVLTPGLAGALYDDPKYDWEFKTVPQKELQGRCVPHPRGKLLGGSSGIYQNKITYNTPGGWNAWSALGNPSWNYSTILPYLKKFHTYHPPTPAVKEKILQYAHVSEVLEGEGGPIQTGFGGEGSFGPVEVGFYKAWERIKEQEGWGEGIGGSASPSSIDPMTKTRSFSVTGYLGKGVRERPNLRIVTEALVEKILLERQDSSILTTGVLFASATGSKHRITARKEVILCAGAFHSPSILELSGIGNPSLLSKHGIEIIVENPNVGENLQDHAMCAISFEAAEGVQTADPMIRDPSIFPALLAMYEKDRSGPLSSFFTVSAYTPSSLFSSSAAAELAALSSSSQPSDSESTLLNLLKGKDGTTAQYFIAKLQFHVSNSSTISQIQGTKGTAPPREGNFITIFASQNHPFSKGNVHILSSDPWEKPAVDPRYLSHGLDMEILARHVQFMHRLVSTAPFSQYFKNGGSIIPASASGLGLGRNGLTIEQAKEVVRDSMLSHFHPVGSCAMLPREKGGVVDEKLRVWGVKGLRVVDASIFPLAGRGNPITSVYVVAERAADLIKEDWKGDDVL